MNRLEFLDRIEVAKKLAGITRVARITELDFFGLPTYQAIRPFSKNYVVSQGKGLNEESAKTAAIMESLEFFHAESISVDRVDTIKNIQSALGYNPLALPLTASISVDQPIRWTAGVNLIDKTKTYLPFDLVSLDFTDKEVSRSLFRKTSNGLGAGTNRNQAIAHSMLEIIERHVVSEGTPIRVPIDQSILNVLGPYVTVLREQNIKLGIKYFISDFNIPTFKVTICQEGEGVSFSGTAASLDKKLALLKAFSEAVQSRLTHFTGTRDDLTTKTYDLKSDFVPQRFTLELTKIQFDEIQSGENDLSFAEQVDKLLFILKARGFLQVVVKDLTHPKIGIPVFFSAIVGMKFTWEHTV